MKCPLLLIARSRVIEARVDRWTDCLKGECAWWDSDESQCILQTIAFTFGDVSKVLTLIHERMPSWGQFGK